MAKGLVGAIFRQPFPRRLGFASWANQRRCFLPAWVTRPPLN